MRRPEEITIRLATDDDFIVVKKHLTAGEYRKAQARLVKNEALVPGERPRIDPEQVGISLAVAYLLDWSRQDPDGRTIPIRDLGDEQVRAILLEQDPEFTAEIIAAVDAHNTDMEALRDAEKKMKSGIVAPSTT